MLPIQVSLGPPTHILASEAHLLTSVQPAGKGQRAVLHIEGEVVDVEAASGHHMERLVVLDLTMMLDIHIWHIWRLPHVHTGQGRGVSLGLK